MFHFDTTEIKPSKRHRGDEEDDDDGGFRAFSDDGQNSEAVEENGGSEQGGEEEDEAVQYSSVFADMNDNLDELGEDGEEPEPEPVQRKREKTAPAPVAAKAKSTNPKKRKRPESGKEQQDEEENSSSSAKASAASKKGRPKKAKAPEPAPVVKSKKAVPRPKHASNESEQEEEEEQHVGSLDALLQNKKLQMMQEEKGDPEAEKSAKRAKIAETKDLLKRESDKIASNPHAGPNWVLTEYTMLRGNQPFKVAYAAPSAVLKLDLLAKGTLKEAGSRLNGQVEAFKSASKAPEEQTDDDKIRLANLCRAGQEQIKEGMAKIAKAGGTSQMYICTSPFAQWDPKKKIATEGITLISSKQIDEHAKNVDTSRVVDLIYRATKNADQDVANHPFGKQLLELVPRDDDDEYDPSRLGWFNFTMLGFQCLDGLAASRKKRAAAPQQKKKVARDDNADDENEN